MENMNFSTILLNSKTDGDVILKTLKRMLISRNVNLQVEAAHFLKKSLNVDVEKGGGKFDCKASLRDILLDADMAEFLCEAMATVHNHLLEEIFVCLEHLARSKKFYNNNHAMYVVECLVRSIHFLVKQNNSFQTLNSALHLLAGILKGFSNFTASKSLQIDIFNVTQLLEMVKTILYDKYRRNEAMLSVGWVFVNFISCRHLAHQMNETNILLFVSVLETFIRLFSALVKKCKEMDRELQKSSKEAVLLISCIISSVTRLFSTLSCINTSDNRLENITDVKDAPVITQCRIKTSGMLLECVQDVCAPYVLKIKVESNVDLLCKFFYSLKALYSMNEVDTAQLSDHLGKLGYLTLLPSLLRWSDHKFKDAEPLCSICLSLLEELLFSMSANILNVADYWPGGVIVFREYLYAGLQFLPRDCTYWPIILHTEHVAQSVQHTVIIFTYFFCLCTSDSDVGAAFLPPLVSYLNCLPSIAMIPIPVTKALWFIFAISSLSYRGPVHKEQATSILIRLLGQLTSLRNVYTHHPALLYWSFSSPRIRPPFQKEVVNLWLQGDQADDEYLMDIILTNNDASYCLMELIQTSNFQVVKRAMKILHDAVLYRVKEGNSELIQTLWDIIPQALARLNTFHTSLQVANVGALLQLACLTIPTNLTASAVVRASYLLTRVLVRQSTLNTDTPLTFYKAAIHHAFILLLKSVELHDKRTLSIYVSEQKFLEVLHTGIASKHPEIRSISTYFLSHLLHYQSEQGYLDCDNSITIESKEILQLLKDDDMDVVTGSLQLLFNLLQSKVASPVARLTDKGHDTVSSEFLQTLFIKLQSMCAKNFSEASWRCLGAILSASASNFAEQNIQLHLATQPWIYFLIRVKRCTVSASGSHYFLYFISQWLQCLRSRNISNRSSTVRVVFKKERALCPNLLSETLSVVVTMMLNFTDLGSFSNGTKQLVLQIMCLLLENEVDLPEKTSEAIRHRLQVIQSS